MSESTTGVASPRIGQAVLFVDDEPKVLQGLERMLRPLRREWTMYFAESGEQALAVLATTPVDILLTDLRMPQMNGAELLQQVAERHPAVIRMVLSGHAERDVVIRAVHVAHQYLSKPCDGALITETLHQAMRLRHLIGSPTLQSMLASMRSLRSVPAIYAELTAELRSPDPSVGRVAEIVARDPAMTAKILQLMNSAYFGLRGSISDPTRAVQLLGLDTVRTLVLSTHLSDQLRPQGGVDPVELWQHSLRTARGAHTIARQLRLTDSAAHEAFTAGLLHDVGKLILAEIEPDYASVVRTAREQGRALDHMERDAYRASHADVAAYLFGLWGLSYGLIEAIAWHHAPSHAGHVTAGPLTALHAANVLDHAGTDGTLGSGAFDVSYLTTLGLLADIPTWSTAVCGSRVA